MSAPERARRWVDYAVWLPALVLAAAQSYAALRRPSTDWLADMHVYRGAVAGLRHHRSLYDFITSNDAPFTYPPFAGLVLLPLDLVAERPAGVAWTLVTVALVFVMARLVANAGAGGVPQPYRRWLAPACAAVLFASSPVSANLRFGQVSVVLALLVLVDVLALDASRWQGVLIGIAAAVKLTPLIFIPMLWVAGRRRGAVIAAATFAVVAGLTWLVLPRDSWRFWGTEVFQVNRLGHISGGGNQSVNGLLLRLGVDDHVRSIVVLVVAVIVGCVALWRARNAYRDGNALAAVTMMGAASVLMSPVSWTHHQVWLVLAVVLVAAGGYEWQVAAAVVTLIIVVVPLGRISPVFNDAHLVLAGLIACVIPYRRGGSAVPVGSATSVAEPVNG